jgi:Domain of unknown function (DUF4440)
MNLRIFVVVATVTMLLSVVNFAEAQQSHWAEPDDKTAKYIIDMERKWAEGVCVDNGVVAGLLAEDFQGTSTNGTRFTKSDELKDEKGPHIAHDCGLDEARVHFFQRNQESNQGDDLAVVYGREHAVGKDASQPGAKICQIWTDTWIKRGGTWQIIASQDNRVECK